MHRYRSMILTEMTTAEREETVDKEHVSGVWRGLHHFNSLTIKKMISADETLLDASIAVNYSFACTV